MNIISKIFIVLLVIITIASSVAVVVVQRGYLEWVEQAKYFEAQASNWFRAAEGCEAQLSELQQQKDDLTKNMDKVAADLKKANSDLRTRLDDNLQSIKTLQSQVESAKLEMSNLTSVAQRAQSEAEALKKSLGEVNDRHNKLLTGHAEAISRIATADAQREYALAEVDRLNIIVAELQRRLQSDVRSADYTEEGEVPTSRRIRGKITAIGGDNVTVDVGEVDGVRRGMTLTVFRGNTYLADMVVSEVQPNNSAGRLTLISKAVQPGDAAWNKLGD